MRAEIALMSGSAFAVTHHAFSSGAGRTSDGNGSHASTLKSPSYTKSVSWQHYQTPGATKMHRRRTVYPEKGRAVLCKGARLKYRFINEHRTVWGVMTMCRVLNVARAGFYAWLHDPASARDKDSQRLLTLIRDSYSLSGGVYGYRRVHGDLNEIGEICCKNRVGRIMQLNRIKAVRGYKAPRRIAGRPLVVAPNRVQRQFTVVRANHRYYLYPHLAGLAVSGGGYRSLRP